MNTIAFASTHHVRGLMKGAALAFGGLCGLLLSFSLAYGGETIKSPSGNPSGHSSSAPELQEIELRRRLEVKLVGAKVLEIRRSPYFGLYEVRVGSDLLYTDAQASYLIFGNVLDGKTMENLSVKRVDELTAVKFKDLPLNDAIKFVYGSGKHQIAYFADPNCPYCKKFEQSLSDLKDTTVYVFLLAILSPDSEVKAKALWCANDRPKAWADWMQRGQMVSSSPCDTPIESNRALGQKINVRGTPLTILENGQKVSGAVPLAQLQKAIIDASR